MGLFWGARREPETQQRSMQWPWPTASVGGTFANATVAGTGAMASVAVRSSIDLICSLVSELPLKVYRGDGADRVELTAPPTVQDPDRSGRGVEDWTYTLLQSWLMRGNAYGQPIRDRLGYLRGLDLFDPDSVSATVVDGGPRWMVGGQEAPDLFHSRVNPMAGVLLGFSPLEAHAVTILTSIAASRFSHQWFTEGTHPQTLLQNTEVDITPEQAQVVLGRWRAMKSGTREPAVLGRGWTVQGLDITPEQAQLLQLLGMSEAQACRIFGPGMAETLGYESGGSMTYSNVQDRRSDLLVMTLNRWARRSERLLSAMLPAPQKAQWDRDALLESTTRARYEVHAISLTQKFKTINEVRADEDLPPVPWGDEPAGSAAPPAPPGDVEPDDDDEPSDQEDAA